MPDPSFEEFVAVSGPRLARYARLLAGDWALAEDLVQDTLVTVHLKWKRVQKMDHPEAYAKKVLTRRFLSWKRLRSSKEAPSGLLADRPAPAAPDHGIASAERDEQAGMLAALPRRQRAVLVLRYHEDMPYEQIAEVLGCTASTARVHAANGIAALRAVHAPAPSREGAT